MYEHAASIIREAEAFVITAGAGMGVDSGLPDFRGDLGFWKAYPVYARRELSFAECATPEYFTIDPHFAWGFFGHCTSLYRETIPHHGFHLIKKWIKRNGADYFVVTSNVDGQFQKAEYDEERIHEVHGSLQWLQCHSCSNENIWYNDEVFRIDEATMRAFDPLPRCKKCGEVSRPNALMFGDCWWRDRRSRHQEYAFDRFLQLNSARRIAVIEIGAGKVIPTIRATSSNIGKNFDLATILRINPRDPEISSPHHSIPCGALEALQHIDAFLG